MVIFSSGLRDDIRIDTAMRRDGNMIVLAVPTSDCRVSYTMTNNSLSYIMLLSLKSVSDNRVPGLVLRLNLGNGVREEKWLMGALREAVLGVDVFDHIRACG